MPISQAKKLELITKHGRKFASKSAASPILEGAHYAADGSIVTTDRHKLLRIRDAHTFSQPFTSHAVTGAPIDGNYPDTSKIFPSEFKAEITLIETLKRTDIKDAISRVKLAVEASKVAGDKSFIATLAYTDSNVTLSVKNDFPSVSLTAGICAETIGEDVSVSLNADYLLSALTVFKDAGSQRLCIRLNGTMNPIVLTDEENGIDVIVLPYRRAS